MSRCIFVGAANMDIIARIQRSARPGETMLLKSFQYAPGGKGSNQAIAAHRAFGNAYFVGKVGHDVFGQMLGKFYKREKLSVLLSLTKDAPTGTAFVAVDPDGENSIYAMNGANGELRPWDFRSVRPRRSDIVTATLETPIKTLRHIFHEARKIGAITVLNAAPVMSGALPLLSLVDYCIVNEEELSALSGKKVTNVPTAVFAMRSIKKAGLTIVATLGKRGAVALIDGRAVMQKPFPADAVDTTGAGDCFVGAFVTRLKEVGDPKEAMRFGAAAAALSVERVGASTAMPKRAEINALLSRSTKI